MKKIKIEKYADIPKNYTGIVEHHNGDKFWLLNGKLHRTDGPAIEYLDGRKNWYLNGMRLNEDKINQFAKKFDYPIETAIKLTYWLEINKS